MVECDNNNCPRERLHINCTDLKIPLNAQTKWYCGKECIEASARIGNKAGEENTETWGEVTRWVAINEDS
jgi:hypothetical protein